MLLDLRPVFLQVLAAARDYISLNGGAVTTCAAFFLEANGQNLLQTPSLSDPQKQVPATVD